jgi:hypothetical protein
MGAEPRWELVGVMACFAVLILAVLGVALVLVALPPPKFETPRDVFGFARNSSLAFASLDHACWDHVPTLSRRSRLRLLTIAARGVLGSAT